MEQITNWLHSSWVGAKLLEGSHLLLILAGTVLVLTTVLRLMHILESRTVARLEGPELVPTEASKRTRTLMKLTRTGLTLGILAVALLLVLGQLGIDIGPILASAGILGLAVGFGAQNLVRDVISGFFMTMENQIRVGDVVKINGTGGLVENISFRTVVLRDVEGTVHVFPHGTVNTLSNLTSGWSAAVFDIGVAYHEDTDQVVTVMKSVAAELRADTSFGPLIREDMEVFGVDAFGDSAVVIKARIKTVPGKQWDVGREYRRRLKKAFDVEGIEIPFPQRVMHTAPSLERSAAQKGVKS
ncbi:MAG: mechanosensitive ion channel [Nitrospirota bacterium]|nr:mechanosensitive ion channel [Nitrospirota bacterium]